MKHLIVGTAGHIDHGKTALIKALTGRDTDTLREEKERGISINLGFTYFDLPSGKRAGIVDVPGHEKFIKNMLAGVSGIDIVLLVIASDEGVMPQTREHLNILSLLDVKKGIVVLTKKDIVDNEWLDVVIEDVRNFLEGTFLENADIIPVSSITGEGLKELAKCIDALSEEAVDKNISSCFRLPVDRVFTISGFGTVVTGTLISGSVSEGDRVEVYPSGAEVKVRNIQVHEQPVKSASAGQRVAINLSNVSVEDVKRGDVVAEKGCMEPSMMIDCRLNYLKDAEKPLEYRDRVRVYHGTSEIMGRVAILDREIVNPGETSLVQIRLENPICAKRGDKYVIRTYSPMQTIGGGTIIEPNPPKRKRFDSRAIKELETKETGSSAEVVEQVVLKNSGSFPNTSYISRLSGINNTETENILNELKTGGNVISFPAAEGACWIHRHYFEQLSNKTKSYLENYHEKNTLKAGMLKEELRSRLFEGNVKQKIFDDILWQLESENLIKSDGKFVYLYGFKRTLTPEQQAANDKIIEIYNISGVNVPRTDEVLSSIKGADAGKVFEFLVETGELVKISEDMTISRNSYEMALNLLKDLIGKNGEVSLAEYRDALNTSRRYAVSLLEYFDQNKITKRIGDNRILN